MKANELAEITALIKVKEYIINTINFASHIKKSKINELNTISMVLDNYIIEKITSYEFQKLIGVSKTEEE